MSAGALASRLVAEHRALDELFGRFLSALWSENAAGAGAAIEEFDRELRRHTREEEESVLLTPAGHKLAPADEESERQRVSRELRLEHVQLRELSGMVIRRVSEEAPAGEIRALAASLARRWDAHTRREEAELLRKIES